MEKQKLEQLETLHGMPPNEIILRKLLGCRGMCELWLASHPSIPFTFMVKYGKQTESENTYLFGQFEREYESSQTLMQNGLIDCTAAIVDFDVDLTGHPYLYEEYVLSMTLARLMPQKHDWQFVRELLKKLAVALTSIHSVGIVHRDIKPTNILLDTHGEIRLIDFALATIDGHWHRYHPEGLAIGTPLYMSPAQAYGRKNMLTSASDWYSVGIILYEWMTGNVPFQGATAADTLYMHCFAPVPMPVNHNIISAPPELPEICQALLCKEPNARLSAVRYFKQLLNRTD